MYSKRQGILKGVFKGIHINIDALIAPGMSHNFIYVSKLFYRNFSIVLNNWQGKEQVVSSMYVPTFYFNSVNDLFLIMSGRSKKTHFHINYLIV